MREEPKKRVRHGEAFWRAHHEASIRTEVLAEAGRKRIEAMKTWRDKLDPPRSYKGNDQCTIRSRKRRRCKLRDGAPDRMKLETHMLSLFLNDRNRHVWMLGLRRNEGPRGSIAGSSQVGAKPIVLYAQIGLFKHFREQPLGQNLGSIGA